MEQLTTRKIYDVSAPNQSTRIVNGQSSNILNWDDTRYPWAYPMYKNMMRNFWIPEEIGMLQDSIDYEKLSEDEKFAFKRIIGLLAFLDSVQTDYSTKVADFITDSSVSALMSILAYQEVVHNQSYSYVLSSLVPQHEQKEIFEYWKTDAVLRDRNDFIAKGYQAFADNPTPESLMRSIVLDCVLEGLFFYSGFAFFYGLARSQRMVSTSRVINYINRDEQIHVNLFAQIFKALLRDFPELNTPETMQFVTETFRAAAMLEITWGRYVIGNKFDTIDMTDLEAYIKFMANKRCKQLGAEKPFAGYDTNPMRWITIFEDTDGKQDFFEGKVRAYAKPTSDNGFDDL